MMSVTIGALVLIATTGSEPALCDEARYATVIARTHQLVKTSTTLPYFNSELVNINPSAFCVRLLFAINQKGKATHIRFGEKSRSAAFNGAALTALQGYLFFLPNPKEKNEFMLIFHPREPK